MDNAKLAVYEHLNTMNECCHHKESGYFRPWVFSTGSSKKFCYQRRFSYEDLYSCGDRYEEKTCDSCKYLKVKLSELIQKLEQIVN